MNPSSARVLRGGMLPARVRDMAMPPSELYLHGEVPRGPLVAIVGTRHPTIDGERYARHLAGVLAKEGVAIASGGADGIDTAAHRGALDVGGTTLVVAPSGFDAPYPERNGPLYRDIVARGGGFLSLVPDDVVALRSRFFSRNELLVALAHVLIVVEAPFRSGARNAARHARRLGRPLFAVPHAPWNKRGSGCLVELELGARVLVSPKGVFRTLEELSLHGIPVTGDDKPVEPPPGPPLVAPVPDEPSVVPRGPPDLGEPPAGLDAVGRRVFEALKSGRRHPDEIAAQTGFAVAEVQRALLTLELNSALVAAFLSRS